MVNCLLCRKGQRLECFHIRIALERLTILSFSEDSCIYPQDEQVPEVVVASEVQAESGDPEVWAGLEVLADLVELALQQQTTAAPSISQQGEIRESACWSSRCLQAETERLRDRSTYHTFTI